MTQAKLVLIFINHKLIINHAIECIVLNWQDYKFKVRIPDEMGDVRLSTRVKIIYTKDIITLLKKGFTKMAAQKSRTTGNKYTPHKFPLF
jgi:hypothetical protein